MDVNKIYNGNAKEVLQTFPNESINCCITSPPYWALRDYSIKSETVFDSKNGCEHTFETEIIRQSTEGDKPSINSSVAIHRNDTENRPTIKNTTCLKCGAWKGQLGLEPSFELYIKHLCDIFDEVKRVLRKDGTCWINIGDTYGGSGTGQKDTGKHGYSPENMATMKNKPSSKLKGKNLCLVPFRFAIEMQNRGWVLRNVIIWHKPNCMPSSVKDRFTIDFEYLFFFVKHKKYFFEMQYEPTIEPYSEKRAKRPQTSKMKADYINGKAGDFTYNKLRPEGRNKRTVWTINTKPFSESHFATFPTELCETPIKAGCPECNGIVLDPFCGAGTALLVAKRLGRSYIGIDLNTEYCKIAEDSIKSDREAFTMSVLKEIRSGKQKILNDKGNNFTKSSVDDFPYQESLIVNH